MIATWDSACSARIPWLQPSNFAPMFKCSILCKEKFDISFDLDAAMQIGRTNVQSFVELAGNLWNSRMREHLFNDISRRWKDSSSFVERHWGCHGKGGKWQCREDGCDLHCWLLCRVLRASIRASWSMCTKGCVWAEVLTIITWFFLQVTRIWPSHYDGSWARFAAGGWGRLNQIKIRREQKYRTLGSHSAHSGFKGPVYSLEGWGIWDASGAYWPLASPACVVTART